MCITFFNLLNVIFSITFCISKKVHTYVSSLILNVEVKQSRIFQSKNGKNELNGTDCESHFPCLYSNT